MPANKRNKITFLFVKIEKDKDQWVRIGRYYSLQESVDRWLCVVKDDYQKYKAMISECYGYIENDKLCSFTVRMLKKRHPTVYEVNE